MSANHDTLYGSVALDLAREPVLLYTPDIGNRFFLHQAMDAHAKEFAYIGTRFTDGKEGMFAFVGPCWRGTLPEGVRWIQSPTLHVWIAGHVLAQGPQDVQTVREIYARSTLAPLSQFRRGKGNDLDIPQLSQVEQPLDSKGPKYFEFADQALNANAPRTGKNKLTHLLALSG